MMSVLHGDTPTCQPNVSGLLALKTRKSQQMKMFLFRRLKQLGWQGLIKLYMLITCTQTNPFVGHEGTMRTLEFAICTIQI